MDLFGKKAVASLKGRVDEVVRELRQATEARDRNAQALEKQTQVLQAAREEAEDLRRRLEKSEEQAARAKEALAQAEKMVAWMSEKEAKARSEAEKVRGERDEAARKAEGLAAEVERLRTALDEARRSARERPEAPPRPRLTPADDVQRLRKENEDLRRALAEHAERLKVALRKAEHNRRAWLVTQMQLDLAEDRLHLLTHGKPRPVLVTREAPAGTPGERVEAEDVEGMEEMGEPEGPAPAGETTGRG